MTQLANDGQLILEAFGAQPSVALGGCCIETASGKPSTHMEEKPAVEEVER